jgi:hypothetical protein
VYLHQQQQHHHHHNCAMKAPASHQSKEDVQDQICHENKVSQLIFSNAVAAGRTA